MEKIVHVAGHLACRRYKQFIRPVDVEILVVDDFILSVYIDQEIEYRTEFQACIRIYRCIGVFRSVLGRQVPVFVLNAVK